MVNSLVFWSIITVFIRAVSIALFVYVATVQYQQFKYKTHLQPLKRLLFFVPIILVLTNIPQGLLSWDRILQYKVPNWTTNLATVTNSVGILITAIIFLLIYTFDGNND